MSERNPSADPTHSDDAPASPDGAPAYLEPEMDAAAMKAFAHPLRMAMYDYLSDHGSATATMLAKHTGESTGQTSYHLRQLERHGLVADDPAKGTGRERWWKALGFSMRGLDLAKDSETRPAVETMLRNQVSKQAQSIAAWFQRAESEDPQWAQASFNNQAALTLALDEAAELRSALLGALQPFVDRSKQRLESGEDLAGARRVRIYMDAFPLPESD